MSPQDIDAIARELNLSASAFRTMAQRPGSPELLSKRLALAGFSENALAAAIETAICNACAACVRPKSAAQPTSRGKTMQVRSKTARTNRPCALGREISPAALSRLIALNPFLTEELDS
ncbi:hypothetical protein [Bradyrhizobium zhanjiangense]|uniref:hypothetical protein n=1 Tax=Bradyrhizobium zhanjiangense TaxID=1325107 RepID=UPI0010090D02|nr:hypothetical protein [Bradyrhizobium zhanjiangense]